MADLHVDIVPEGPTPELMEQVRGLLSSHPQLQATLGERNVLLSMAFTDSDTKPVTLPAGDEFSALFYSYTRNEPVTVRGALSAPQTLEIISGGLAPRSTNDEFQAAVAIVKNDSTFGERVAAGDLIPYRAMPPVIDTGPDGARTIALGLLPKIGLEGHTIVGVDMVEQRVERYDNNAPAQSAAHNPVCGLGGIWQETTMKGTPGQATITVTQAGAPLWQFTVVRPAASSGLDGSAVELRQVTYKGRKVLERAHAPILNVLYDDNACGPYRDWQWEEGAFVADGSDLAPGIRLCTTPARTILDSGKDRGSFRGVSVHTEGPEVVLKSELEAGWYRYISEWRFDENGTIKPRFGFSAVKNSCVCARHHHHVYWRFDFDIDVSRPNRVEEALDSSLPDPVAWTPQLTEVKRHRNPGQEPRWRVVNPLTGAGYTIVPGHHDGTADDYGRGDVWLLRYNPNEIDDGTWWQSGTTAANLDKYVNGETLEGEDVVVWYAGHFTHEPAGDEDHGHRIGPDLNPHMWI